MASSLSSDGRPSLLAPEEAGHDPFVADLAPANHRLSDIDHDLSAAGPDSPTQVRRALEARIVETDRRLDEAGKLGTALVSQRKALTEQLQSLEKLKAEAYIGPDLRKKLVDIEREFNDVARESARVFLPRQRVPSNEANSGSPHVPEARSGGLPNQRSVSPSKFESQATGSPTKLNVPNRKSRNQPSTRVHDIEFAAEISTSLIAQVRNLQSLLSERDEELKTLNSERTKLEIDSENLQQRLRTLDESEHRYKEENWNLETRLQEFQSLQREATDREKRLAVALSLSTFEKDATQKELEEAKLSHARLTEEHVAVIKHHDIELGTVKRTMATADGERAALQLKIEDLTNQNQELARAFSMQRARGPDRDTAAGHSDDDLEAVNDSLTPEHSPPVSPIKGTPRHSMLETETVKTSLQHAQRTIQSQRNQLHREKTEKLELRRIIQDLRDELEKVKNDAIAPPPPGRSRKIDSKDLKKPPRLLGNLRSSRHEILVDDLDWEDTSPRAPSGQTAPASGTRSSNSANASDFETANEATESAFETANEPTTETEGFQTGHEGFSGSNTETETEGPSRDFDRMRRAPNLPAGLVRQRSRDSFRSTASTSADEREPAELRTPTTSLSSQRSRMRLNRASMTRGPRHTSDDPNLRSSPASFASGGTPQAGQSLFAELRGLGGSDEEESAAGTPSRRSLRSTTPGSIRRHTSPPPAVPQLPRVIMVDSGVMTDPVKITAEVFEESSERPMSVQSVVMVPISNSPSTVRRSSQSPEMGMSRPLSSISQSDSSPQCDLDIGEKLAQFPVPPSAGLVMSPTLPSLNFAPIQCLDVEPRLEAQQRPSLCYTRLSVQQVEPQADPEAPSPALSLSTIIAEGSEPVSEPEVLRPELIMSPLFAQVVDPVASPPPSLTFSLLLAETIEPVTEPKLLMQMATPPTPISPTLNMSSIMSQKIEPINEPEIIITSPSLSFSTLLTQELEPREALEEEYLPRRPLTLSSIMAEHVQPVPELQPVGPTLSMSSIVAEHTHPILPPSPISPTLGLSSIATVHARPVVSSEPETSILPDIGFSRIKSIESRPISPRSPKRDGFILPRDDSVQSYESSQRETLGLASGRGRKNDFTPVIAEDETRLSIRGDSDEDTAESPHPFREISSNSKSRLPRNQREAMNDQGAQTALTCHAIDKLLKGEAQHGYIPHASLSSFGSIDTMGTVRIHRSQESLDSSTGNRLAEGPCSEQTVPSLRPGSAASAKGPINHDVPPLPPNHRQLIDAARSGSSRSHLGSMRPPLWPFSAMKQRPFTPNQQRPASSASARATPTPRAGRGGSAHGTAEIHSPTKLTVRSRQSSVSSFASELDSRFNIQPGEMGMDTISFSPSTDPRIIQAITQTMIGEFLWKYTRKTGRGEMSENRHRRYFWVHPYTRTLYWSNRDPSEAGRSELKAKSVPIEAVRVVSDDNPMPPGLHRKSLIVISPGRTVKFTCTTGQRHETWFNALSYLLLRANRDSQSDVKEVAENMTREDVDEFNSQYEGRQTTNGNHVGGVPPSLSSYHSRTTRNEALTDGLSIDMPTLTPANHRQSTATRPPVGTLGKLSVYWKVGGPKLSGTFSSLRGRGRGPSQPAEMYEASEVHDSAEDLRVMIERQDKEADRLENVRTCCDGKHDVGTLHHTTRRGRNTLVHGHPGPSS